MAALRKQTFKILLLFLVIAILISFFYREIITAMLHGHIAYGMDLHHFYSWRVFTTKSIMEGKIPLWGPYTFGGYPFLASLQPAVLYPATLLHLFLPINPAYDFEIIITLLLMSLFMFLWLRGLSLSGISVLFGTIIFVFSGFIAYRIYAGHISVLRGILWLPLLFYFTQKAIKAEHRTSFLGLIILSAYAMGFQITSGIPQFVVYTILNLSLFVLLTGIINGIKNIIKGFFFIILTCAFCFLLFSVQILPTLEGFRHSSLDRSFEYASTFSLPFYGLLAFIFPNFLGSPLDSSYRFEVTGGYFWELQNYISIAGLFLVIFAIYKIRGKLPPRLRDPIIIMSFISFFSLLIALGKNTPFFEALSYMVPGLRGMRVPSRILGVLSFSLASVSACGLEIFSAGLEKKLGRFKKNKLLLMFIILIITMAAFFDLYIHNASFIRGTESLLHDNQRIILEKLTDLKKKDPVPYWRLDSEKLQNFGFIYSIENIRGANTFHLALFDELVKNTDTDTLRKLLNVKYIVLPKPETKIFDSSEFFIENTLEQKPKLTGGKALVEEDIGTRYEFFEEGSYKIAFYLKADNNDSNGDFPVAAIKVLDSKDKYLASKEIKAADINGRSNLISFKLGNPETLKILLTRVPQYNFKLWLEKVEVIPYFSDPSKVIYQDISNNLLILKNEDFLPRIAFVPFVYPADTEEMLSILRNKAFDPRSVVLLERAPGEQLKDIAVGRPYIKEESAQGEAGIEIQEYTPEAVIFSCNSAKKGILLLSQIFYPGWQAEIDGSAAQLLRANYGFCGIPVTAGLHEIKIFYRPRYWKPAVIISLSMFILSFTYLAVLIIRRPRWVI